MALSPTPARPLLVLDCSAVAALLFAEAGADAVERRLRGAALAAPQWLAIELANVCIKKMRRRPQDEALLTEAYQDLALLDIALHPVEPLEVLRLAHATSLSFYDACYLWLARRLDAALVTLDTRLAAASRP